MEELFGNNRLGELEEKIDVLVKGYREMREQKGTLTERIQALEAENKELKEQMTKAEGEKDVIMRKVKGILEKIQRIEV
jgi:regulator of replication initiation timing